MDGKKGEAFLNSREEPERKGVGNIGEYTRLKKKIAP